MTQVLPFLFHFVGEFLWPQRTHENFDARFEFIVAATVEVINAEYGFQVSQNVVFRQKFTNHTADYRCASKAAAHQYLEAYFACGIADELQTYVVEKNCRAIRLCAGYGNFEFAR